MSPKPTANTPTGMIQPPVRRFCMSFLAWQCLYFLPLPQGQGSFWPTVMLPSGCDSRSSPEATRRGDHEATPRSAIRPSAGECHGRASAVDLTQRRRQAAGPMRMRATHFVLPIYFALALLYTWPLARDFSHSIPASGVFVDAPAQAFILGWDGQALARFPGRIFDPPIFYPERNTLTYMDHLIGETVLASPMLALFPSVAPAYNVLVLFSFAFSAWGAYRLTRLFAVSRGAAFLAGFLYVWSP